MTKSPWLSSCRHLQPAEGADAGEAGSISPNDPYETDPAARHRVQALKAFLLDRNSLMPALVEHLGGATLFESVIRGSSMSPAIPARSRLRVQTVTGSSCGPGDIVFYLADTGFMVHRVILAPRRGPAAGHLLTQGDNCLAPDAPVSRDRVLGTVLETCDSGRWRAPGPPTGGTIYHRLARSATCACMFVAMHFTLGGARRLARLLQEMEAGIRPPLGRFLRRMRIMSAAR